MRMDKKFVGRYDHSQIDPAIKPLLALMRSKGLESCASCAGFGPAPSTHRRNHGSWLDMPHVVLDAGKCTARFSSLVGALRDNPMPMGETNGIQILATTTCMNELHSDFRSWNQNRRPCPAWSFEDKDWPDFRLVSIQSPFEATGLGSVPMLAATASAFPAFPKWVARFKKEWVRAVGRAIGSMPDAELNWESHRISNEALFDR